MLPIISTRARWEAQTLKKQVVEPKISNIQAQNNKYMESTKTMQY